MRTSVHPVAPDWLPSKVLDAKPNPGRPSRLSDEQLLSLESLLRQGAKAHGWPNELWTCSRVACLIERHFGVRYHRDHVRKILPAPPQLEPSETQKRGSA